jgi:hypothetical protein
MKLADLAASLQVTVETFAVSCVPNKDICSALDIHAYPSILFFPSNSVNGTKVKASDLNPRDVMRMAGVAARVGEPEIQRPPDGGPNGMGVHPNIRNQNQEDRAMDHKQQESSPIQHFLYRSNLESFQDAHLSFDFAMRTAVHTSLGPLPEHPKKALSKFLDILQRTLPVSSTMQPVLHDLTQNFESITQNNDNLIAVMDKHPTPTTSWSPASLQHGTGYTAGLWQLFHIMSVGLVEWNHVAMSDQQRLSPLEVADSLRNYVEFFFQCEVCRINFLTEYDSCSYDRCNRLTSQRKGTLHEDIQYPLWLYETHNAVNVRLRKERIELHDEEEGLTTEVQVMWPPIENCPSCWLSEGRWEEMKVFEYLLKAYWQVIIRCVFCQSLSFWRALWYSLPLCRCIRDGQIQAGR